LSLYALQLATRIIHTEFKSGQNLVDAARRLDAPQIEISANVDEVPAVNLHM
jgi:hypothetical protein